MDYHPPESFGQHLRELRKAKGWSQERLALESGLDRGYVGSIERGQRNLTLINICILADTLCVPPSEMLNFFPGAPSGKVDYFDKRMALEVIEDALKALGTPEDRGLAIGLCGAFYMCGLLSHAEWETLLERIPKGQH